MSPVALARRARPPLAVPVTPLVDVLLILLIFFMVTSTFLDLGMIPMAEEGAAPAEASLPARGAGQVPLLIRLDPAGRAVIAGQAVAPAAVAAEAARRRARAAVILPSPRAPVQALVELLGAVEAAGIAEVSVVRLDEAGPP